MKYHVEIYNDECECWESAIEQGFDLGSGCPEISAAYSDMHEIKRKCDGYVHCRIVDNNGNPV